MKNVLWIAAAGALGTLTRYGLGKLVHSTVASDLPWGTLAANLAGCFLFGLVWAVSERGLMLDQQTSAIVLVGFMGGLTTFSSFIFDTRAVLAQANWGMAVGKIVLEVALALVVLVLGIRLGRAL